MSERSRRLRHVRAPGAIRGDRRRPRRRVPVQHHQRRAVPGRAGQQAEGGRSRPFHIPVSSLGSA